ncbi:hypothetical protein AB0M39_07745 [Streptomyces sp. NPDC051907]|uniref:hypothetical protein n=1 Tax=Streptomyces sp. NPDC051907 TaxID=3155284 RepID=UPI0034386DFE
MKSWTLKAATLAGSAMLAATAATAATASAQAAPAPSSSTVQIEKTPGDVTRTGDGWCHFTHWGGSFYCLGRANDVVIWQKPDGYPQVFVLGTNRAVYSRWSTASGVSSWYDGLRGSCKPDRGFDSTASGWSITIACVGDDGGWWHNTRSTSGSWSDWKRGKGF